jgi:hypothetical protein
MSQVIENNNNLLDKSCGNRLKEIFQNNKLNEEQAQPVVAEPIAVE